MTINLADNDPRIEYSVAQGVTQDTFAVPFEFFNDADLSIYVDGVLKEEGTDYTITGGDGSTGEIEFVTATPPDVQQVTGITGGSTVVIVRTTPIERTSDFSPGADINRAALNEQFDVLTAMVADAKDRIDRTIHSNAYEVAPNLELPSVASRKGKVLAFHATTGAVINGPTVDQVADAQQYAEDAAASAAAASDSEDAAAASELAAASSESHAASSEAAASASELAAAASEAAAATSEANAASSESAAAASEAAAASSEAAAAASESAAATSETNAAASASSASSSATAAAASADAALSALDSFDDRYLGQKASDPSVDNDGNALIAGALYYNTTDQIMKVYDGLLWVAAYASLSGALLAANNLSDLTDDALALQNLGLTATAFELNVLDGITASTAELNILDGVTATAAEINILDGVTASTAELNILDGVTATAAELNILDGVTATAAELNTLDGITGIASQAQAEAGTDNATLMTPLRVAQAVDALAPPSGIQTFTAGGAIASGSVVSTSASGKIVETGIDTTGSTSGNFCVFSALPAAPSGYGNANISCFVSETKLVSLYYDTATYNYHAIVHTVDATGNITSSGSITTLTSGLTGGVYQNSLLAIAGDKFIFVYGATATTISARVGTVSGNTITLGSITTVASTAAQYTCATNKNNEVVVFFKGSASPFSSRCVALSVSGTTISVGGWVVFYSTTPTMDFNDVVYDPTGPRYVFVGNAGSLKSLVCTVSGTTITTGSLTDHSALGTTNYYGDVLYSELWNAYIVTGSKGAIYTRYVYRGTVSGMTLTLSASTFNYEVPAYGTGRLSKTRTGVPIAHVDNAASTAYSLSYDSGTGVVSGTPMKSSDYSINAGNGFTANPVNSLFAVQAGVAAFSSNVFVIGVAASSASSDTPVSVYVDGGVAGSFSSLAPGSTYYVGEKGGLSATLSASYPYKLGKAVNATTILVQT